MFNDKIYFIWDEVAGGFMPTSGKIYKNSEGHELGYGVREISQWLASEIHGVSSIDFWLSNLQKLRSGITDDGDFGLGNAHWTFFTENHVMISCEYVDNLKVLLFFEQFEYVLQQYKDFLCANKDKEPDSIDIEYIAEGDEAVRIYSSLNGAYTYPFEE